ncbi:MAG: hypothetical protein CVU12_01410 [Bacteroidetes bacterium HGW-Bacteroidetes-7]|jgi:hypothetical protein|nr:MAG: hypothetical protein CVU12_01410 [Bacteroidetes bacterium HGW-Bacteroidetes-7]
MSRILKTTSSEKILIHFDKEAAERKAELIHACAGQLNHVLAEFGKLNEKAKINSIEELKTFFGNQSGTGLCRPAKDAIKALFIEKLIPGGTINGLPVRSDFIQIPDLSGVFRAVEKCHPQVALYLNEGDFELKDCLVTVVESVEDRAKEYFSIYAETDAEIQRLEAAKDLILAVNNICNLLPENPYLKSKINLLGEFSSIIEIDDNGKFEVNPFFVKQGTVVNPYISESFGTVANNVSAENGNQFCNEYLTNLMKEADFDTSEDNERGEISEEYFLI